MGFPSKLRDMGLFLDGNSYKGEASEVTLPKLTLKLDEWRGGGMLGPVMIDNGLDKLEAEFKVGGLIDGALRAFGSTSHDAALVRFVGAYQEQNTGAVQTAEVVFMGRYSEIDFGGAKTAGETEHTYKMACSYYQLDVDGQNWLTIDLVNGVFSVFGIDRYAEIRAAIGD